MGIFVVKLARAVFVSLTFALSAAAMGQESTIAPELLNRNFSVSGDAIRFCIGEDAYQRPLEEAIVQEIAGALLIDARVHHYPPLNFPIDNDYVIGPTLDEIYVLLNNDCDAFMGMNFVPDLADWITYSRPLYTTDFVLVARRDSPATSLVDLGAGTTIGTRVLSVGDLRLGSFLRLQEKESRPARVPYNDNGTVMDRLISGDIDAALVWEPALSGILAGDQMAELKLLDLGGMNVPDVTFGVIFQSRNTFLRGLIDSAIEQLREGGIIDDLVAQYYAHSVGR
jgi:ABC-type amino acid transport substrate-binding protein